MVIPLNILFWCMETAYIMHCLDETIAGGIVTVTVTATTFPSLTDLIGLFSGSGTPTPTPVPPVSPSISTMPPSHGSSMPGITPNAPPVSLPNIQIQSASLSASKVSPGTPVTVTAHVANRGTVNCSTRIKLYVNGEEDSSQGVTVESGGSRPLYFTVNRSQPGTYAVYIGNVQAGSFMVDDAIDPNIILFISCVLIFSSVILGAIYIWRRQRYEY